MEIKIALAGNPNCGKTTLFNALTGANQYVGNWPGVTVEKKEGKLKKHNDVTITDLPGIYSLSPYTLEEVVARNYLIEERPSVILNIVDGTNLERNLFLTTQLTELGIPVVVAINMMDVVRKRGDTIKIDALAQALGCKVVEISALKGDGIKEAAEAAIEAAKGGKTMPMHTFSGPVEHAIAHIEEAALHSMPEEQQRWYAVKLFERDSKILEKLNLSEDIRSHVEADIETVEKELDDDAEAIITNDRYVFIGQICKRCYKKKSAAKMTHSDKIDRIVTNRVLALPIFVVVMFLVYAIAMGPWSISIGTAGTDWANDGLFGDGFHLFGIGTEAYEEAAQPYNDAQMTWAQYQFAADQEGIDLETNKDFVLTLEPEEKGEEPVVIDYAAYEEALKFVEENEEKQADPADYGVWVPGIPSLFEKLLDVLGVGDNWVRSLIMDGIVAGVGAVLGFVPQMLVLFLFLAMLEDCGYMSRVAFIMDRMFRRFGLSGKSFIPMLVATGCGVPGIMASRTIEQDRDRKMTIITTGFIPCGAKLPIIGLFAGALFGNSPWIATSAFFIGIGAVVVSGIMLKKFKAFAGEPAPFVMELPSYHVPVPSNVLRATWERGWSFIKRAGTIILLSSIVLWFLQGYGFTEAGFGAVEDNNTSLLAAIGNGIAWLFYPLGWVGENAWKATVATITGLIAKEEVVNTFAILYPAASEAAEVLMDEAGTPIWGEIAKHFTGITAYSFMIFNLLCAPCFAAMGAIKREMNNWKWTTFAIGYMCVFAYVVSMIVFQVGSLFAGGSFSVLSVIALVALAGMLYLMFRKGYVAPKESHDLNTRSVDAK